RVERRTYDDIIPAVEAMRQLVILGDPGAGKTTTLWQIAGNYLERAKADPSQPLPVFLRFGEMSAAQTLEAKIRGQLGTLGAHYEALLAEKRLALLLDGLNELPADNRAEIVKQVKALVERCQKDDLVAVITCRELDYVSPLDMGIPERLVITPLDPLRIR